MVTISGNKDLLVMLVVGIILAHSNLVECSPWLTSDISPLNGFICPLATLDCMATDLPSDSLRWFFNAVTAASYLYEVNDEYPLNVTLSTPKPDVMIQIVGASGNPTHPNFFNFNSTMTANLSILQQEGVDNISCGSTGTMSDPIGINLNIRSPSPSPDNTCFLTSSGAPVISLQWSPSFTSQHDVERYRVAVTPDPSSSCSNEQVSPSENYSCSGLNLGTSYSFNISAINCGNQEGPRETFTVHPQVPSTPDITTQPTYGQNGLLNQLKVQWNHVPPSISERCSYDDGLDYTVVLTNSSGGRVDQKVVSSDSCSGGLCSTSFSLSFSDQNYLVSVSATNAFGPSNVMPSTIINGSLPSFFSPSFTFENCMTSVLCSSPMEDEGECVVRYSLDSSLQELGPPVQGPLNSSFTLPLMETTTTYYYQITINSSLIILFTRNFTTGEFAVRLTSANQGLLVVGVLLWSVASIACIILIIMRVKTGKGSLLFLIVFVVWCVLAFLSLVLWVAVGFQVGLQTNTCDPNWKTTRDNLIIFSFVFAVLTFLTTIVAGVMFYIAYYLGDKYDIFGGKQQAKPPIPSKKEEWEIELEKHSKDDLTRGKGGRIKELEENIVNEFRETGESFSGGHLRAREEYFQKYTAALSNESDVYSHTRHDNTPQGKSPSTDQVYNVTQHGNPSKGGVTPLPPSTYSELDRLKAGGKGGGQYPPLNPKKGVSGGGPKNNSPSVPGDGYSAINTQNPGGTTHPSPTTPGQGERKPTNENTIAS